MPKIVNVKKLLKRWKSYEKPVFSFKRIKFILKTIRIFGSFPYSTSDDGVSPSGVLHYAWAAICLTLLTAYFVRQTMNLRFDTVDTRYDTYRNIIVGIILFKEFILYAAFLTDYLNFYFRYDLTFSFFEKLEKFDNDARRLGHPRQESILPYWISMIICICITLTSIVIGAVHYSRTIQKKLTTYEDPSTKILEMLSLYLTLKWIIYAYMIYQRFKHLNVMITNNLSDRVNSFGRKKITTQNVAELHASLIELVKIFNSLASFILLLLLTSFLISALMHTTKVLHGVSMYTIRKDYSVNWFCNILVVNTLVQVYGICHVCNMAVKEGNDTGRCVTDVQGTLMESYNNEEKIKFAIQLFHNRVTFFCGDVFEIDLFTFRAMVVAFFTFGVVLTTIDQSEPYNWKTKRFPHL